MSEYRPPNVARWASICRLMGPHMLPGGPPYASQHKCPHLGRPINGELSDHHFLSADDVHAVLCGLTAEAEAGERVDLKLWLAAYITDTR